MIAKDKLPAWAWPDRSPHAGGEKDLVASFYDDERNGTISVAIERMESPGVFNLSISAGGLHESAFTRNELGRVIELAGLLLAATK